MRDSVAAEEIAIDWIEAMAQRRGGIVAVPRLELAAMDVLDVRAASTSYAAQAAKEAEFTAAKAEWMKRTVKQVKRVDHLGPVVAGRDKS